MELAYALALEERNQDSPTGARLRRARTPEELPLGGGMPRPGLELADPQRTYNVRTLLA